MSNETIVQEVQEEVIDKKIVISKVATDVSIKKQKNILLVENKPSLMALLHLNMYIYLNGKLEVIKNADTISVIREKLNCFELIITRNEMYGFNLVAQIKDLLQEQKLTTPMIVINSKIGSTATTSIMDASFEIVQEPVELKQVLKKSATILKIEAKAMAEMMLPTYFNIPSKFFQYLQFAPCDIYTKVDDKNYNILFTNGLQFDDFIISETISLYPDLYVLSKHRLKFVNSFSDQLHYSAVEEENYEIETTEKVFYTNKQMEKVSTKLRDVGVDQEVIDMSNASIARLLEIAKGATDLSKLVNILVSNDNGFRFKESQLLTYMTFHVLKILNLWTEKKMQVMTYAAFFHDLLLDDNLAVVRNESDIKQKKCTPQQISAVDNHAGIAAQVIKKVLPNVSNETLSVLREHHGSISGRGFCDEISSFGPLSKIFFLTQKWVYKVLTTEERNLQQQDLIKNLKKDFSDNMSVKIIDALALVEVNEILYALTGDLHEHEHEQDDKMLKKENVMNNMVDVIIGDAKEDESKMKIEGDSSLTGIITKIKEVTTILEKDDFKKIVSSENQEDLKQLNFMVSCVEHLPTEDRMKIVTAVTMVLEEGVQKVSGIKDPNDEDSKKILKGITQNIENVVNVVKGKYIDTNMDELIKVRNKNSRTLLMVAAQIGSLESTKLLVEGGADVKAKDSLGKIALHYAAIGGNLDIVSMLVNLGSSVNVMDSRRRTPIVMAINHMHNSVFDFLIKREAHTNLKMEQGMDLVMFSASVGNLYALSKLAELKLPLNSYDYKGRNAYFFAKNKGHKEIMTYLQEKVKGLG